MPRTAEYYNTISVQTSLGRCCAQPTGFTTKDWKKGKDFDACQEEGIESFPTIKYYYGKKASDPMGRWWPTANDQLLTRNDEVVQ